MPHLVLDVTSFRSQVRKLFTEHDKGITEYGLEVLDIVAGLIFVVGSACFLPPFSHDLKVFLMGCVAFVLGGAIYLAIAVFGVVLAYKDSSMDAHHLASQSLYLAGAITFEVGTIFYWPDDADQVYWAFDLSMAKDLSLGAYFNLMSPEFEGTLLFIAGSLMLAAAAFWNGLHLKELASSEGRLLSLSTSLYMAGALFFVMGSVAFLPEVGCNDMMVGIGAWCYIVGSLIYVAGGVVNLERLSKHADTPELRKLSEPGSATGAVESQAPELSGGK
eukprot:TRINITY_DN25785_c0_g1_i2.p1 TRINITY_DN25785_c0_g1~~TRINITY_DN25785_c0_g1_i2.p1  ORF type:complete len:275 (+),score=49.93 TRINITY_DN25785_c0_g1_i2:28-852(+)